MVYRSSLGDVVCLFEESGLSARAWAVMGYSVYCYDLLHTVAKEEAVGRGVMHFIPWDARDAQQNENIIKKHRGAAVILLSFPPCTDLAVSGARHFKAKKARDPDYLSKAMSLVYLGRDIGERLDVPYCIENPVSVISSEWRKPDYIFDPSDYGGYLPVGDVHPLYPDYIAPRDAYPKKTCYWTGSGFVMPPKIPVKTAGGFSSQYKKLGGKSAKTKRIRSASSSRSSARDNVKQSKKEGLNHD